MIDKNDGTRSPGVRLHGEVSTGIPASPGLALRPGISLNPVGGARHATLLCGALLGFLFAWNVCAETETPPGVFPVSQSEHVGVPPAFVTSRIAAGHLGEKPLLVHEASVNVTSPTEGYAVDKGVVVEALTRGGGESSEGRAGVPHAIVLAMVAMIGLVPMARRDVGL